MRCTQLTQEELYILKKAEYSQPQIAGLLESDKSTSSRDLHLESGCAWQSAKTGSRAG
jgi:hypothetical protein